MRNDELPIWSQIDPYRTASKLLGCERHGCNCGTGMANFDYKAVVLCDGGGQHHLLQRPPMHFPGGAFRQVRKENKSLRHFVVG